MQWKKRNLKHKLNIKKNIAPLCLVRISAYFSNMLLTLNFANTDRPPIGFCILLLLGSKYDGLPVHWALAELILYRHM